MKEGDKMLIRHPDGTETIATVCFVSPAYNDALARRCDKTSANRCICQHIPRKGRQPHHVERHRECPIHGDLIVGHVRAVSAGGGTEPQ